MIDKPVTLEHLLTIEDFSEKVVLFNKKGNLKNVITYVTIMEGPDLYPAFRTIITRL